MTIQNTIETARYVEGMGYKRYWLSEHHGGTAFLSSATAVLIGAVASATSKIRVGAGGVMLPNHAPLLVAENFGTLESLHCGRIDLGLGQGVGGFGRVKQLLRAAREETPADFESRLTELLGYFEPDNDRRRDVRVGLAEGNRPPVWILGSSVNGARLAGKLGLPFAYAHHIKPDNLLPAVRAYREAFHPSPDLEEPYVLVYVSAICANTDEDARRMTAPNTRLWYGVLNQQSNSLLPTPEEASLFTYNNEERAVLEKSSSKTFTGSRETVRAALECLIRQSGADELMIASITHDQGDRLHSYALLAELGLSSA